jgi:hypothetical protein
MVLAWPGCVRLHPRTAASGSGKAVELPMPELACSPAADKRDLQGLPSVAAAVAHSV